MPVPAPAPPIYIGGQGRRMIELMGEIGDGGLPVLFPPDYLPHVLARVRAGAVRAGRNPETVDVSGCIWYSLAGHAGAAHDALRPLIAYYGPVLRAEVLETAGLSPEEFAPVKRAQASGRAEAAVTDRMFRLAVSGSPEDIVTQLAALAAKGLRHVNIGPPLGPDPEEALRLTGAQVIPALRNR
jgi:5,10-methylenetetrahydromethanopterin reductase